MWKATTDRFLLLNAEQAKELSGYRNAGHEFIPRRVSENQFIAPVTTLESPHFAEIIPLLMKLPHCKIETRDLVNETQELRVVPGSVAPAPSYERTYEPNGDAFNRPPFPPRGDWSAEVLYASVGRATSAWERVEVALSDLFTSLLGPNVTSLPAERAYGSVTTSRGRVEMVKAAAEAYFLLFAGSEASSNQQKEKNPAELKVAEILRLVGKFAERRNDIAHGIVGEYTSPDKKVRGLCLLPPRYATKKNPKLAKISKEYYFTKQEPIYAYASPEIKFFEQRFLDLTNEIHVSSWALQLSERKDDES